MAELASGAVHTLLGVIRNEAQLLGRVRNDVQFIREEMESMNSFLHYLARTTPPGGEHNAQVRTWMKQVRDLACECSNSIEIYLRRRDPSVYRARGLLGYVWWLPWFVKKLLAQRLVATQIHELKNRAREVGERRLRYGVEVPAKADVKKLLPTSTQDPGASDPAAAAVAALERSDHGLEDDDDQAAREDPRRELAFSESSVFLRCAEKLINWLRLEDNQLRAVAIAAPDEEDGSDILSEALNHLSFEHTLSLTPPAPDHPEYWVLGPLEALQCILRKLLPQESEWVLKGFGEDEIDDKIKKMEDKIKDHLQEAGNKLGYSSRVEPLDVLRDILQDLLQEDATAGKSGEDQTQEKVLEGTAEKMKKYLEPAGEKGSWCWIGLHHPQYVHILRELLPKPKQTKKVSDKSGEDQIVKIIKEITLKIQVHIPPELLTPQQEKSAPKEAPDQSGEDQMSTEEEIAEKIKGTLGRIKEHLLIQIMQETAGKIKEHLQGKRTLIVLHNIYYAYNWGKTMEALSKLDLAAGSTVVVITKYITGAAEFCYQTGKEVEEQQLIIYSYVQFYHDTVLQLTDRRVNHDEKYDANIFRDILLKCKSRDEFCIKCHSRNEFCIKCKLLHEFCIKVFVRALYANPNRSKGELDKLSDTLVFGGSSAINCDKMIKFSYNDLLRDYKTCLLYLAIFPRGQKIRRSSLVGRWVAEGLITGEDWPSSVRQAERCFDTLVDRLLVDPCDIDAAGKVKSCKLHRLVHDFITKIAKKEHITDTRLSHNWARHFSILSNIRLRPSDSIAYFLEKPSRASSQLKLLKVLDLEGCECLRNNEQYLKNVCNTIILLKFLSLRNTGITELPKAINGLHQLEVLDIRQTAVRASATKHLMLLKLKRLLASRIDQSSTSTDVGASRAKASFYTVRVPENIGKMTDMEALSYVQASKHCASKLRDIGHLWQLRKLGVVIHDWKAHLENLLKAISDLNECLRSLSIEIIKPPPGSGVTTTDTPADALSVHLQNPPKLLESLSISGITMYGRLLPLLAKGRNKLAKVTLHNTSLNQDDMEALAKLANLHGLRLLHVNLHIESKLTFKANWFKNLKYLVVDGSNITDISFETEAAPKLKKIVWTFTNIVSLSGINNLPKLKELEFNGDNVPDQVMQAVKDQVMQAVEDHPNYIVSKFNG